MKKILLINLLIVLTSCASRKVNKSEIDTKIENKTDIKDSSIVKVDTQTKIVDTTSTTEIITEPIDSTKPMIIDYKDHTYQNVRFKEIKLKKAINISKVKDSVANQVKITHNDTKSEIKDVEKHIDKEPISNWWWLIILIIIFGLGFGYYEYKK